MHRYRDLAPLRWEARKWVTKYRFLHLCRIGLIEWCVMFLLLHNYDFRWRLGLRSQYYVLLGPDNTMWNVYNAKKFMSKLPIQTWLATYDTFLEPLMHRIANVAMRNLKLCNFWNNSILFKMSNIYHFFHQDLHGCLISFISGPQPFASSSMPIILSKSPT